MPRELISREEVGELIPTITIDAAEFDDVGRLTLSDADGDQYIIEACGIGVRVFRQTADAAIGERATQASEATGGDPSGPVTQTSEPDASQPHGSD